ncbi:SPON1 [Cordylochernes scorpioides]|uniref:SPON1 n=1 Tax=Cordylochernes scorpioides TaxID=51811 RepID=A0ABY6L0T4_9ARAC|nr:SPON1 [Cordylochernes scorpioides]
MIRFLQKTIRGLLGLLSPRIPPAELGSLLLSLTSRVDLLKSDIGLRHQRKLDFWRMKHGFPSPPQSLPKDNIVNLTDTELSASQISLLKKGLNFCLPKKPDLLYTVSCIEASLQHQALTDKHHIRSTITGKLLAYSKKSFFLPCAVKRDLTTLKALKNQRDTIITRSDKGSQVVLMKAEDYSKKMLNILSDPNTFQEISADRVKAISGNYRASLRSLLKKVCITPEQFKLFTSNISSIPYIYGLPKTHKPDIPLRPIVAYHLSPALHLARYLSNFLKPLVKAHNIYSIQDSSDFIAKLKNFSQSGSPTMSTFDVTSLFLSLPHSLIFDGLGSLLNSPSVSNKDQKVVFELFNICLGMNTLEFNGRFFLQIRGSPMGSPLSTTAAEIVMSYLDRWLVSQIHLGVVMWARYVDDIFCLHQSTDHSPILTVLNSYHSDLRFTHNSSRFNCIPFLDVLVVNLQGRFHTTVFRKAGFTPSYLHFSSHAPVSHKITTVKTLSKRVFTHCSLPLFSRIEKRIVYLHLLFAGYPRNFIDRHFYSPNHDSSIPPPFKDVCVLPFSTTNSDIGFYLRKFGIRTFFKKSPSLGTSLRHPLTKSSVRPSPQSSSNAIYRIPCNDCPQSYVGETGRTIATRVLEHERNIRSHDRIKLEEVANTATSRIRFEKTNTAVGESVEGWSKPFGFRPLRPGFDSRIGHFFLIKKENAPMAPDSCKGPTPPASASNQTGSGTFGPCEVTQWSEWSPCTVTCGRGTRVRTRLFLVPSKNSCDVSLQQESPCVAGREDCTLDPALAAELCLLPKNPGPCRGYYPRWYYDPARGQCLQFAYGGCRGSRNNFRTYSDCNRMCENMLRDRTALPHGARTEHTPACGKFPAGESDTVLTCSVTAPVRHSDQPVIDCVVTPWSPWTACSRSCGGGRRERRRMVLLNAENGGRACPRKLVQRRKCKDNPPCAFIDHGTMIQLLRIAGVGPLLRPINRYGVRDNAMGNLEHMQRHLRARAPHQDPEVHQPAGQEALLARPDAEGSLLGGGVRDPRGHSGHFHLGPRYVVPPTYRDLLTAQGYP